LADRNYPDTVVPSRHDKVEVTFQIVVSGDKVSRVTPDRCLEDFVVIGIATCPQITGNRGDCGTGNDEAEVCLDFLLGIAKPSGQARTPKDLGNLGQLGERCDNLKVSL
jgi:hypothetical protein